MNRILFAALALFIATLSLGLWIATMGAPRFDPSVSRALADQRVNAGFWLAMTHLGELPVRVAIAVAGSILLWRRHERVAAGLLPAVLLVQTLTNSGLKLLFARQRPTLFEHLDPVWDTSFPSGHSAQTAAVYLLVALVIDRRLLWLAVPVTLLVGVSRIVLGVHWPTDVIGGWMEGAAFALLGWHIIQRNSSSRA